MDAEPREVRVPPIAALTAPPKRRTASATARLGAAGRTSVSDGRGWKS